MDASPPDPAKKRSAAAREFAEIPRTNRALAGSRWAPVLPSFAFAVAALAACGAKEDAGPERAPHATVRASQSTKEEGTSVAPPTRAGDEPSMAGLATPVAIVATVASSAKPPVVPVATVATAMPTTPPIRTAGARAPTLPTATAAPAPSIAPSYRPPTVKGKMPSVRAAPLDEDGSPPAGSAPCPNPKGI
jgi:hypothetical protein